MARLYSTVQNGKCRCGDAINVSAQRHSSIHCSRLTITDAINNKGAGCIDCVCRRHKILITPHKRNEVKRSVGWTCAHGNQRVRDTLLSSFSSVPSARHLHVASATPHGTSFRVGLLRFRAFNTTRQEGSFGNWKKCIFADVIKNRFHETSAL